SLQNEAQDRAEHRPVRAVVTIPPYVVLNEMRGAQRDVDLEAYVAHRPGFTHVTRNLGRTVWVSADALARQVASNRASGPKRRTAPPGVALPRALARRIGPAPHSVVGARRLHLARDLLFE